MNRYLNKIRIEYEGRGTDQDLEWGTLHITARTRKPRISLKALNDLLFCSTVFCGGKKAGFDQLRLCGRMHCEACPTMIPELVVSYVLGDGGRRFAGSRLGVLLVNRLVCRLLWVMWWRMGKLKWKVWVGIGRWRRVSG